MQVIKKPSPNFTTSRRGYQPQLIVIHIMDGTLAGTDAWFANRQSKVSAHYSVGKRGEVHQHVEEKHTAQHAGIVDRPSRRLVKAGVNPNLYTIGIEHEGRSGDGLTEAQLKASAELIADIARRWEIRLDREHVIAHYEIRRSKTCPGTGVDLAKLILLAQKFLTSRKES